MRKLDLALYPSFLANVPAEHESTWSEFVSDILQTGHQVLDSTAPEDVVKKQGPAFSPVKFNAGTLHRQKHNVQHLSMAVLDFDHLATEAEVAELAATLQAEGLRALLWTTWRHGKQDEATGVAQIRVRAALPFSEPVEGKQWGRMFRALQAKFPGIDPACKDQARLHALPACPPSRAHEAWILDLGGDHDLDSDVLLASVPAIEATYQPPTDTALSFTQLQAVLAGLKRKKTDPKSALLAETLSLALEGNQWAPHGSKHERLRDLSFYLVCQLPNVQPSAFTPHFAASAKDANVPLENVEALFASAHQKLSESAQEVASKAIEQAKEQLTVSRADRFYTAEDVAKFAAAEGMTPDVWRRKLIAQTPTGEYFYVWTKDGYEGPYSRGAIQNAAHALLYPLSGAGVGVQTLIMSDRGTEELVQTTTLIRKYGAIAKDVRATLIQGHTSFDGVTIMEGTPRRKLTPQRDERVERWLDLLGGERADELRRWVAWSTRLDRACLALLLIGKGNAGKTLLAKGLARIFRDGPAANLCEVMGNFNEEIKYCPILLADEEVPKDWKGRVRSEELRALITAQSHPLRIKGRSTLSLKGGVRIVMTANNHELFEGVQAATADDINAIARRFLTIDVGQEPVDYLQELTATQKRWGEDAIAQHALWLAEQIPLPVDAPELLIDPPMNEVIERVATGSRDGQAILQWLSSILTAPSPVAALGDSAPYIRAREDALFVNVQAYTKAADRGKLPDYLKNSAYVTRALANLTVTGARGRRQFHGAKFRQIRMDRLVKWASDNDVGTEESIRRGVDKIRAIDGGKTIPPPSN